MRSFRFAVRALLVESLALVGLLAVWSATDVGNLPPPAHAVPPRAEEPPPAGKGVPGEATPIERLSSLYHASYGSRR